MWWDGSKVSDHGRTVLNEVVERIGTDTRMVDGTLRRYSVAKKRTWSCSWENLPSTNAAVGGIQSADGGMSGEEMEDFYRLNDDKFRLVLRRGSALNKAEPVVADSALPYEDNDFYIADVMLTEFTKDVGKRGKADFWNVSVTLVEV